MYLLFIKLIGFPLYFAPGYVNTLLLIKTFVYTLEPALTNYMVVSAKPAYKYCVNPILCSFCTLTFLSSCIDGAHKKYIRHFANSL